jgi:2-isopropylmalate synthase/UPF0716 protein FxsA
MIYFFIYLFVEVLVSVKIAGYLGGIGTFLEIMLSGFIGIVLLANVKTTMMESFKAMSNNCISMKEFQELNIFALLGAILLILPGLLSDIIGVLMQFSVFTGLVISRYQNFKGECPSPKHTKGEENVIDVEIVNTDTHLKQ